MWHGGGEGLEQQTNTSQQRIFWGINHTLIDMGYHTVFLDLGQVGDEEDNARREAVHLRYVMDRGFGGAIFYPYAYRSNHALVQEVLQNTPLVMIDRRIAPIETDFVGTANYQAMFDTVMHLVEQGHQRIAYVSKFEMIQSVQDRMQGYLDAVRTANLNEIILTIPAQNRDFEWTVLDSVFRLPKGERPTAAAVFNDYAACDLLDHLIGLGLSVPRDVALTGFDNIIPMHPNGLGMTTVAQSYEEIGQNAAQLLLRRLKDPKAPFTSIELPGTLIVRDSSSAKFPT
jgi:DNA-binding LacI/PurR family transcriptional regulator